MRSLFVALAVFLHAVLALAAAPEQPNWHIVSTMYPATDIPVAGFNVLDFGAISDGRADCTPAFQQALDRMQAAGGGTVFVPEGRYAFKGNLKIPVSVTLRGEWRAPSRDDLAVRGTVLMPYGGKGNAEGEPFITVDYCAGIRDLNIWYPQQSASHPVPYPFCLVQKGGDNATFENLTLVNPYLGIRIGPGGNELHLVRNVYGSPLKTGIRYDSTTDIGRLESIHFSPHWWCRSGLPNAPATIDWIRDHGTAIRMLRSDWEYVADVHIDGYQCGFRISEGVRGAANAQFYRLIIRNCTTAMEVEKTNPYGMVFTECCFEGRKYGILVDEKFDSVILFSTCLFSGREAVRAKGNGNILMEQCRVLAGNIVLENGAHSVAGTTLAAPDSRIYIGDRVVGVALAGNRLPGGSSTITGPAPPDRVQQSSDALTLNAIPDYPTRSGLKLKPGRAVLEVMPPTGNGTDDTPRIQRALQRLADDGGGIVFLPAGDYIIRGHLTVPSGVELRGIHDVPHHTMGGGSILHVYPPDDQPTLRLETNSGLRGLSGHYPDQQLPDVKPYPFFIQGRGSDIYVINVNCANPYQFLDFMTHRCDHHYLDYPSGAPLKTGIAIGGGSRDGTVKNMQLNPHYALRPPRRNRFFNPEKLGKRLWAYQKEHLDALVLGDCSGEFLFQNFVFGSLYGIHFTHQSGRGAVDCLSHGHGTDGSKVGVYFEHGNGTVTMVNNELVAMSTANKSAIKLGPGFDSEATLINTMVWGSPDLLAEIDHGTLTLQNLHAHRHGQGIQLNGGTLRALNLHFNQHGQHVNAGPGSEADLTGMVTRGPFHAQGTTIVSQHVIERE